MICEVKALVEATPISVLKVLVNATVGFTCDRGAHAVVNGEGSVAFAFCFAEGGEGVNRFTGLADRKYKGIFVERGVAVAEFGGVFDFLDGDASEAFDEVFSNEAGVPGRAAGKKENAVNAEEFLGVALAATKDGGAAVIGEASTHTVFQGGGLLEDFLLHKTGKVTEFGGGGVPVDLLNDGLYAGTGGGGDAEVVGAKVDHFVVVEVNDVRGAAGEGADV